MVKTKKGGTKAAANPPTTKMETKPWVRTDKGGWNSKADDRAVDEDFIAQRLAVRTEAKAKRDYATADRIASELQTMGICYLDDKKEWYTKVPLEKKEPSEEEDGEAGKRKRDNGDEKKASAKANNKNDGNDDDAPSSDDETDSEDEREDEVLIAKVQAKLAKENGLKKKKAVLADLTSPATVDKKKTKTAKSSSKKRQKSS